jgi:uncharacterized protein (DUF3084 family)
MSTKGLPLPNDVEQLKAMIARQAAALAEREEVINQKEAIITQKEEVIAQNEVIIASQHETIEKQLSKLERLHQELARLLRRQYGPQKERIDPNQLSLFTAEELSELIQELQQSKVDSVSPPHLPREVVVHELNEHERLCPCCGRPRTEIGRDVSEQLEYIPAQLKVLHLDLPMKCARGEKQGLLNPEESKTCRENVGSLRGSTSVKRSVWC